MRSRASPSSIWTYHNRKIKLEEWPDHARTRHGESSRAPASSKHDLENVQISCLPLYHTALCKQCQQPLLFNLVHYYTSLCSQLPNHHYWRRQLTPPFTLCARQTTRLPLSHQATRFLLAGGCDILANERACHSHIRMIIDTQTAWTWSTDKRTSSPSRQFGSTWAPIELLGAMR